MILRDYARRNRLKLITSNILYSDKVLDLGCGDMWVEKELLKLGYNNVVSTDMWNGNIYSDAKNLPFKDKSFDVVIVLEVLEHVSCMEEILRILKPSGKLIVTLPNPDMDFLLNIFISLKLAAPKITPHLYKLRCKDINLYNIYYKKCFFNMSEFAVFLNNL